MSLKINNTYFKSLLIFLLYALWNFSPQEFAKAESSQYTAAAEKVKISKVNQKEFEQFIKEIVPIFAQAMRKAGTYPDYEIAFKAAESEIKHSFTEGFRTPNQHIYNIIRKSDNRRVGFLWLAERSFSNPVDMAWITHIFIAEDFRRKGYATAAMLLAEKQALSFGRKKIGLNVFNFNDGAQDMYRKLGYKVLRDLKDQGRTEMCKDLE